MSSMRRHPKRRLRIIPMAGLLAIGALTVACPSDNDRSKDTPSPEAEDSLSRAADRCRKAVRTKIPMAPEMSAAVANLEAGRFEEARVAFSKILESEPGSDRARLFLAVALHKAKRHAEAIPEFQRVLEGSLDFPRSEIAFHFYGWCLYWNGDATSAKRAFEVALSFHPDDFDSAFGLGVSHLELLELDQAEIALERSLAESERQQRKKDMARALARLGDVALQRGDRQKARTCIERSLSLFDGHAEVWRRLAKIESLDGHTEKAGAARQEAEKRER